ncbi:MAG: hydroxylamine reductase [Bacteriovoracaceae bacterium]|nr:hydroxylamine reductase [Bacteriovoracaceae bacterium]
MSMFCYQCQETMKCEGCSLKRGVCGKEESTANLQDELVHYLKAIALKNQKNGKTNKEDAAFLMESLFATITNANFDDARFKELIGVAKEKIAEDYNENDIGVLATKDEDVRSLRELVIYGLKGISAYAHHAYVLGYESDNIYNFMIESLASTTKNLSQDEMIGMVMKTGEVAVETMALLDKANTETYGNPEITKVNIGVGTNPGILISGHDLKDMEELLKRTEGTGIDVYTHSEMLPANYYPKFKKYKHLVGNYGNAWWKQNEEFESFNGPILMTTNCITPVKDSYRDRIFTTGVVGYKGVKHIAEDNGKKDFSEIIELAKKCAPPKEIEKGEIVGGFAHHQVLQLADKIVEAVKSGAIKKFIVMAGCDGRHKTRDYFTKIAGGLPQDTVILTAGCAKYRYNKLDLGNIGGIPRVLDAGQCNDSYSLAVIALKLKEVFGLNDINKLPIEYDIAWYEQKAVTVLLALLHLGVKGIRLGPTLPAFLSPNVVKILVENFNIKPIGDVDSDLKELIA